MTLDILVVDDIAESRQALCALVVALGHRATGVDGGAAALAEVQARRPDLVLLDLLMPGLDGFEVTARLRALTGAQWLPVIATSSLQGDEHVIEALRRGADDHLSRPVNPALLEAKLRHYGGVLALQSQLAVLAQRQRAILDSILDPVLTLDEAGRVQDLNRAAATLRGADGAPLARGSDLAAVFGLAFDQLLAQRELWVEHAGGAGFPAELSFSHREEGGQTHTTLVFRDLTERREIERMKDEFLATVSHELRTPLTSVVGALGLLAGGAGGSLPQRAGVLVDMAQRNGERLSRLIDDVLDLTRLEADRLPLRLRRQHLPPLLHEALAANQGYAARASVELVLEGAGPARGEPAADEPVVMLDGERFLQVMANLLSNAIKHSPPGERVLVSLAPHEGGLRVQVRDRGPGVSSQFRARMFEKFSQADVSDRRARGGTGLGLYITRLLVERMGGRIRAEPPEGPGATFTVWFPVREDGAAKEARSP